MSHAHADIVRNVLQEYADRGVFRGFQEFGTGNGRAEFRILCFPFIEEPFTLVYSQKPPKLIFQGLLEDMPARSEMYARFKTFIRERTSADLPDHRRIDPGRAELKWSNRLGKVNVSLAVKSGQQEYATRKAINLLADVFLDLLAESPYYEYMCEHFDMPED